MDEKDGISPPSSSKINEEKRKSKGAEFENSVCNSYRKKLKQDSSSSSDDSLTDEDTTVEKNYQLLLRKCQEKLILQPDDEQLLNELGLLLYRMGHYCEALSYFLKSCVANPDFLSAKRNFEGCCNLLVERWHFRMLNDNERNAAFRHAIMKAVSSGYNTVLDIGTGTGLLSLFAAEAKAKEIYACDQSPLMIYTATKVLEVNNVKDKIKLINKMSFDLQPYDVGGSVSLVVTETVDSGLFGEGIVNTIIHAWQYLLNPKGRVIPSRGKLWVVGVECIFLAASYRHMTKDKASIQMIVNDDELYDTAYLDFMSKEELKYLTEPYLVFEVDFNNYEELVRFSRNYEHKVFNISCKHAGRLDALVTWFDLYVDNETVISSRPGRGSCWEQAVYPVRTTEMNLSEGDGILIQASYDEGCCKVNVIKKVDICSSNSENTKPEILTNNPDVFTVPHKIIRFLNDEYWVEKVLQFLNDENWVQKLKRETCDDWNVLDLLPFPVVGLKLISMNRLGNLWCLAEREETKHAIIKCAQTRKLNVNNIHFVSENTLQKLLSTGRKFNAILVHPISSKGEISESKPMKLLSLLKDKLTPDGLFMPDEISIYGQLVYSHWLKKNFRVLSDEVTCSWKIADCFNAFQTPHHLDLNLFSTPYVTYSQPKELLRLNVNVLQDHLTTRREYFTSTKDGNVNAMIFWFRVKYTDNVHISTFHKQSHINQAAILFTDTPVSSQSNVAVDVRFQESFFDIKMIGVV